MAGGGDIFGIGTEDIFTVSLTNSRIYREETWSDTQVKLANRFSIYDDNDAFTYNKTFVNMGDTQFNNFDRAGRWFYKLHPEQQTTMSIASKGSISERQVRAILQKLGDRAVIVDMYYTEINKDDWCKWRLQEEYGYSAGADLVELNNVAYSYGSSKYISSTDAFRITLIPVSYLVEKVEIVEKTETKSTTTVEENYHRNGTIFKTVQISKTTQTGTFTPSVTTTVLSTELHDSSSASSRTVTIASYTNPFHFVVKYLTNQTDSSTLKYWVYNPYSGEYPELKSANKKIEKIRCFPIIPLRKYERDVNSDKTSLDYKRAKEILQVLSIDADDIIDKYHENDTSDLRHVFFLFGLVPIYNNKNEANIKGFTEASEQSREVISYLLYYIFNRIYSLIPPVGRWKPTYSYNEYTGQSEIEDYEWDSSSDFIMRINHPVYNNQVTWQSLNAIIKDEVIGYVGKCYHEVIGGRESGYKEHARKVEIVKSINNSDHVFSVSSYVWYYITDDKNKKIYESTFDYDSKTVNTRKYYYNDDGSPFMYYGITPGKHITNYLMFDTGYTYTSTQIVTNEYGVSQEVEVEIPIMTSDIELRTQILMIKKQINEYQTKSMYLNNLRSYTRIAPEISDDAVDDGTVDVGFEASDFNFLIPIPYEALNDLTWMQKTALYCKVPHLQFWTMHVEHLEWYETAAWGHTLSSMIQVATMAISAFTMGSAAAAVQAGTATLTSALSKALVQVALTQIMSTVGSLALKELLKMIDSPILKALAVAVALIAAAYAGGAFSSLNFSNAVQLASIPVKACNMAISSTNEERAKALMEEEQAFRDEYKSRMAEIEVASMELLKGLNTGDVLDITQASDLGTTETASALMVSPTQFVSLAVDAYRNIDLLYTGFYDNAVHNFVANSLKLGLPDDDGSGQSSPLLS